MSINPYIKSIKNVERDILYIGVSTEIYFNYFKLFFINWLRLNISKIHYINYSAKKPRRAFLFICFIA